jgi:hypothetical protein
VYLVKEGLRKQHVRNKYYCKFGDKATGTFRIFKIASGAQRMGTAY